MFSVFFFLSSPPSTLWTQKHRYRKRSKSKVSTSRSTISEFSRNYLNRPNEHVKKWAILNKLNEHPPILWFWDETTTLAKRTKKLRVDVEDNLRFPFSSIIYCLIGFVQMFLYALTLISTSSRRRDIFSIFFFPPLRAFIVSLHSSFLENTRYTAHSHTFYAFESWALTWCCCCYNDRSCWRNFTPTFLRHISSSHICEISLWLL